MVRCGGEFPRRAGLADPVGAVCTVGSYLLAWYASGPSGAGECVGSGRRAAAAIARRAAAAYAIRCGCAVGRDVLPAGAIGPR